MHILKFGGSSVGNVSGIQQVCDIISSYSNYDPVVVVSAMQGITDKLEDLFKFVVKKDQTNAFILIENILNHHLKTLHNLITDDEIQSKLIDDLQQEITTLQEICKSAFILKESGLKLRDYILSFGEKLSAKIITAALQTKGIQANFVSAENLIETNDTFGEAIPDYKLSRKRIQILFNDLKKNHSIPIITGFISSTKDYITTTLGRNGSDFSASIIGSLLNAKEITIFTDVTGIFSADPSVIPQAKQITELSYEEAFEMSFQGAKVIHPKTLLPASEAQIPIRIKNTFDPENPGTLIKAISTPNGIKVINLIPNISVINIIGKGMLGVPGISGRTFNCARKVKANVLMISQSAAEQKISFALNFEDTIKVINELNQEFSSELERKDVSQITKEEGSILCCVGEGISENPSLLRQIFEVLEEANIKILMMVLSASEKNLSIILRKNDAEKGLRNLHQKLMEK